MWCVSRLIVCRLIVFDIVAYIMEVYKYGYSQGFWINRQQTGLSQEAFAEKCGMHRTYISAIECFRRSISLENIQRIADALGVEPYKLFLISEEDA